MSCDLVLKAAAIKMKYPVDHADAFAVATAKDKNSLLMTGEQVKEFPVAARLEEKVFVGFEKITLRTLL